MTHDKHEGKHDHDHDDHDKHDDHHHEEVAEVEDYPKDAKEESLKSELLTLNMGPQHPATHGVLRIEIKTDSEIVSEAKPYIGYLHRCMEKHTESLDYRGIIPFVDRLDYLAAMNMEVGYALTVEKMLGTEVPARATYIRTLVSELQRIASHLVAFGTYALDLGAFTPFLYAFDQREKILRFFEEISGARLLYNYVWIGGVWNDVTDTQLDFLRDFIEDFEKELDEYHTLVTSNSIFRDRTANVAVIDLKTCLAYGATGPVLRGAGHRWDLRKVQPYLNYNELEFDVPVGGDNPEVGGMVGDCLNRYYVRMREMRESLKIIKQLLLKFPSGPIMGKVSKIIKLPKGEIYMRTECPRGELGFHIVSQGGKEPYRIKVKSPCFTHVSILPVVGPGLMIADFVAAVGSIDIVLGEVDR
ncbi:MAG: NADH-quinone oxidoreductase subunit D [Bacteriovoracaceae bacterium]|nr:NADH-quinone oxidoreductase subunit D [Bacteriovoracaceae bacterium]